MIYSYFPIESLKNLAYGMPHVFQPQAFLRKMKMKLKPAAPDDKRKNSRFKINDDVFAAFRNGKYKVGLVKDISLGGLAFDLIDDEDTKVDGGTVDVFVSRKKFYVKGIPCRIVYKKAVARDPVTYQFISYVLSRCGIQFTGLDEGQALELKELIETQK